MARKAAVGGAVYRDGRDRDAGRHLDGGEEGVQSPADAAGDRDADDRKGGMGGEDTGQMGGHAGSGDDDPKAVLPGGGGNAAASAGVRWADITWVSQGTPYSFRVATAFWTTAQSESLPIITATFFILPFLSANRGKIKKAANRSVYSPKGSFAQILPTFLTIIRQAKAYTIILHERTPFFNTEILQSSRPYSQDFWAPF